MLYAMAAYTGLRASELASLTHASLDLSEPASVSVEAAYSKRRRRDILPLHHSLAVRLRPWVASRPTDRPLWPGRWANAQKAAAMLRFDLEAAGVPYIDAKGRFADFHALRHKFITNMVKSGVMPKAAQMLARHSTIDLTMNAYTSLTIADQATALASLPPLPAVAGHSTVPEASARRVKRVNSRKTPTGRSQHGSR